MDFDKAVELVAKVNDSSVTVYANHSLYEHKWADLATYGLKPDITLSSSAPVVTFSNATSLNRGGCGG